MTHPLRTFMLNEQITIEARRIAHEHTPTCNKREPEVFHLDECHTKKCNALKKQIEELALQVKLACMQPSKKIKARDDARSTQPAAVAGD
jgi:hypothetical protein